MADGSVAEHGVRCGGQRDHARRAAPSDGLVRHDDAALTLFNVSGGLERVEGAVPSGTVGQDLHELLSHGRGRTNALHEALKVPGHEHACGGRREEHVHVVPVGDGLRGTGKANDGLGGIGFRVGHEFDEHAAGHGLPMRCPDFNHAQNHRVLREFLLRNPDSLATTALCVGISN